MKERTDYGTLGKREGLTGILQRREGLQRIDYVTLGKREGLSGTLQRREGLHYIVLGEKCHPMCCVYFVWFLSLLIAYS